MTVRTRWMTAVPTVVLALAVALVAPAPAATPEAIGTGPDAPAAVRTDDGGHWADGPEGGEFARSGTRWMASGLTYGFDNHTADVSVAAQEAAIAAALATWSGVAPLAFAKVPDCGLPFDSPACAVPDIRVRFGPGDHGAGGHDTDFDGPGGVAAHAYYPPPNGHTAAGDLHLDDAERWTTTSGGVDLQTIALHEIGHALGLGHAAAANCSSTATSARPIMCGTLIGVDRTLARDDIEGIQAIYGPPLVSCAGRAVTVNLLLGQSPTTGPDVVLGTPFADEIVAGGGNDVVCGDGGADVIDAGPGDDRVLAGSAADLVTGGPGVDHLEGSGGNDRLRGDDGNDSIYGGGGADTLDGGAADDRLYAGPQVDSCNGRAGRDRSSGCERSTGIEARIS
jgi:Ca2+-binding RTX toxin-like protein